MKSKKGASATADAQQTARVEEIRRMAEAIFENNDMTLSWMRRENIALGNAKPIELCDSDEGAARVRRVLSAIEHGNSA